MLLSAVGDGYLRIYIALQGVDEAQQWMAPIKPPTFWQDVCDSGIMEAITQNVLLIIISILNPGEFKWLSTGKSLEQCWISII